MHTEIKHYYYKFFPHTTGNLPPGALLGRDPQIGGTSVQDDVEVLGRGTNGLKGKKERKVGRMLLRNGDNTGMLTISP